MSAHQPTRWVLYAVLAIPGTVLPRSAGVSLWNAYYELGWPLSTEVTVYGPNSGYSGHLGVSAPAASVLLLSFLLWYAIAVASYWAWRRWWVGGAKPWQALVLGGVCTLWAVFLTSFIFFLGATTWERCLDHLSLSHGLRCARLLLAAQPWVCLALLAVPPVALFLLSARYRLAARLSFCSIPAVLLVVTCLAAAPLLELQQAYLNLDGIVRVLEEETTRTSATGETGGGGNDSLPGARPGGGL